MEILTDRLSLVLQILVLEVSRRRLRRMDEEMVPLGPPRWTARFSRLDTLRRNTYRYDDINPHNPRLRCRRADRSGFTIFRAPNSKCYCSDLAYAPD